MTGEKWANYCKTIKENYTAGKAENVEMDTTVSISRKRITCPGPVHYGLSVDVAQINLRLNGTSNTYAKKNNT